VGAFVVGDLVGAGVAGQAERVDRHKT
jgi:hypothetical protein